MTANGSSVIINVSQSIITAGFSAPLISAVTPYRTKRFCGLFRVRSLQHDPSSDSAETRVGSFLMIAEVAHNGYTDT